MVPRFFYWGCLWATAAAAQVNLLDVAMPDARFLAGANIERVRESRIAQALWAQLAGREREVAELSQLTGFDPLRDLSEILIASAGGTKPNVLFAARGAFDRTDLAAVARRRIAGREVYQGVEILLAEEKQGEPMALAFLGPTLLVAGDPASVRGAIERRGRVGLGAGQMRQQAEELKARYDAWGFSAVPVEELAARAPKDQWAGILAGDLMRAIEQVSGGLSLGEVIELELRTVSRTGQDAANLADALRFFSGMLLAREPAMASYLRDLSVEGRMMRLVVAIPESELWRMMNVLTLRVEGKQGKVATPAETGVTIYSSPSDMGVVKLPPPGKPQ